MYHHVREPGPGLSDPFSLRFDVSPAEFAKQLDYLQSQGYTTIDSATMAEALMRGGKLPPKPVMLTFDDGWAEHSTVVMPLLQARRMVGVFFVHIGSTGQEPGAYVSWPEICEMEDEGMDIESHTLSHPSLPGLDNTESAREIGESRSILEAALGRPVRAIAYPFGDYTAREITLVEQAGYEIAFSTEVGLVQSSAAPYDLHRTIITFWDTLDDFAIKLTEPEGERTLLDYRPSITPNSN